MTRTVLSGGQVKSFVSRACREVEKSDGFLLDKDVSEWAVAHRLATYLEKYFSEYHIDCEYNRMPGVDETYGNKAPKKVLDDKKVRPDIIIHIRGSNTNNLLAIELKKAGNPEGTDSDKEVLCAMRDELKYTNVCMIVLDNRTIVPEWL